MKQHFFSLAGMFFSEPVDTRDERKQSNGFEDVAKRELGGGRAAVATQFLGRRGGRLVRFVSD
jgi:hypothetical protein